MSLYRSYRPQSFADVAGQEHIVTTLQRAVEQDKLSQAYLFAGQRGTGKTSIARILAKAILTGGVADAKMREQIITAVEEGSLVDLIEIDAASNTGVDNIRDLIEKIQFSPVVAAAKVYIIDEAHMLSKGAFNALLKTLEEPPSYAFFILATTELHKIPMTIQSRCQQFLFRQISEDDMLARMEHVAGAEKITIDREAMVAIAHHVQGSMRDALSLLDQLRSLPAITVQDVKHRIGETGHEYVEQMLVAIRGGDRAAVLQLTRAMEENAVPLENFVRLMLGMLRQDLHAAVEAKRDTSGIMRMLDALLQAIRDLRAAPVPGLVLESALLSLCPGTAVATAVPSAPVPRPSAPTAAKPQPAPEPPPGLAPPLELTFASLQEIWPEVIAATEPAAVRMSLKNGHLHALQGNVISLTFTSMFHREKVSAVDAGRAIEAAIERFFKRAMRVECLLETQAHEAPVGEAVNLADVAGEVF